MRLCLLCATGVGVFSPCLADPSLNGFHFCLETDDFAGAVAALKDAGVAIATEPHTTATREPREANGMRAVFKGLDGESIEIRG